MQMSLLKQAPVARFRHSLEDGLGLMASQLMSILAQIHSFDKDFHQTTAFFVTLGYNIRVILCIQQRLWQKIPS